MAAALFVLAAFVVKGVFWPAGKAREYSAEKMLRFTYTLTNTSAQTIASTEFQAFLPLAQTATQKRLSVESKTAHRIVSADSSAPSIVFTLNDIPPYGTRLVKLTLKVAVADLGVNEDAEVDASVFLKDEKYIEVSHPPLQQVSQSLQAQAQQKIEPSKGYPYLAYQWVADSIDSINYVALDKGAAYAIDNRRGDCTEHMYTFVALMRANNMPARGVSGFVINGAAKRVSSSDYHNWAEYYDGQRWVLVDPQRRRFDSEQQNYIAHRYYGAEQENEKNTETDALQSASRFLSFDSRIKVSS